MTARAFITGVSGVTLTASERSFLRDAEPWGFILFGRNVSTPAQISKLVAECREAVGTEAPVLIDQEGGRVQRLGPPDWPHYPSGATYGRIYDSDVEKGLAAARLGARLIASDLLALGIDVDCLPIADVPVRGANDVIGDRAYGRTPEAVAAIAGAVAAGLLAGGVLPVLKHIPGHGRARADSHERLPVVKTPRVELETCDFAAFRPLSRLPMGMTAHVVFSDIDPLAPATTSATIVQEVIRGFIGFQGLLMSDDIGMGALSGSTAVRTQAALAAGCDVVLHCNGKLEEMQEVAAHAPKLLAKSAERAAAALALRAEPEEFDPVEGRNTFAALIADDRPMLARGGVDPTERDAAAPKARRIAEPLGRNGRRRPS
jgi:beta-N-acetylhexosaminidase